MQTEFGFWESGEEDILTSKKRKGRKKWIVLAIVALLFVAALISAFVIFSKPEVRIMYSMGKAVNDIAKREEIEPLLELLESGSVQASVKGEDLNASGKIYISGEEKCVCVEDLEIKMDGKNYQAEAYAGLDSIYISSKELLGGSYGFQAGSSQQVWQEFWGKEEKDEAYYVFSGIFELYDEEQIEEFFAEYTKICEANAKEELKLALEYGELSEEKKQQRIGDKKMKVRVYRLVLDEDAIESIDEAYLDYLEMNEDVREFLHEYEKFFINLAGKDADFEDIDEIFEEYIEEERDTIGKSRSYTKKYVFQLTTKLLSAEALAFHMVETWQWKDGDPYEYKYSIESDEKGLRDAQKLKLCISNTDVIYQIKENTDEIFSLKISTKDKWGSYEGTLKLNKDTERFTLSVFEDGEEEIVTAKGGISLGKDSDTVRLTELSLYGEETPLTGEITFCREDSMPLPSRDSSKFLNSLDDEKALEEELTDIATNLEEFFCDLFSVLEKNVLDI